ncbi:TetR/AcrR family transcriptional regulator [Mesorhizobium sp.]|uniref:TetR/AcrR family transcriptional regulator n=1 Tax=Mesorhizobium sp. TaxID=1871066 RepID=UPI0025D7A52D|nr:TetR/AcrR family transcriptional regulator [Mesorhizobium sp.]
MKTKPKGGDAEKSSADISEPPAARPGGAAQGRSLRSRLPPHERERLILDDATRFFAEHGFDANMRDLAKQSGISQGLIFKYFESKEKLVNRVYESTFLQRWRPEWERMLTNKSESVEKRLGGFYKSYLQTVDEYIWIRIALFSGLSGNDLTTKYIRENVASLMKTIALELRREAGEALEPAVDLLEMEQVWMLHSTFIYYLIRKHIFRTPTAREQGAYVDEMVRLFLFGRLPSSAKEA